MNWKSITLWAVFSLTLCFGLLSWVAAAGVYALAFGLPFWSCLGTWPLILTTFMAAGYIAYGFKFGKSIELWRNFRLTERKLRRKWQCAYILGNDQHIGHTLALGNSHFKGMIPISHGPMVVVTKNPVDLQTLAEQEQGFIEAMLDDLGLEVGVDYTAQLMYNGKFPDFLQKANPDFQPVLPHLVV